MALRKMVLGCAGAAAWFITMPAMAAVGDVVPGVDNTGVDANGSVLPVGSLDPHYRLNGSPATVYSGPGFVTGAGSAYVGLSSPNAAGGFLGNYTYATTFDLTGFDPLTAVLTGSAAADDSANIYLNGLRIGDITGFTSLQFFSVNSGFVSGVNTLEFQVFNINGPTGIDVSSLRVTARSVSSAVPEPATWALMLFGFGAVGTSMRRKRFATTIPQFA